MAENQARRAFITFREQRYPINVPSEGQLLALSFVQSAGLAEMMGVVGEVVHYSLGDALWGTFIKGLASGEYTGEDFTLLTKEIMQAVKGQPESAAPDA